MIELHGLSKDFAGHPAVDDLTFRIPEGSLCALLGPNGAGKTTTVRLLLGLLEPSRGTATVAGVTLPAGDIEGARLRASAGILTESPGFYDRMTGRENLFFFGRLYGLGDATLRTRMEEWFHRLELWDARDRLFGNWSKGMKQRLALIRAFLHEPRVIFLDEPTAGLDPAGAREVRDLITELKREGRTILLCTHNLAEAEELADLVAILRRRLLAFGTEASLTGTAQRVEVLLDRPAEMFAESLRGRPGVVESTAAGPVLRLTLTDLTGVTPALVRALVELGAGILAVRPLRSTLEEIYLKAVGGEAL
jgi:ABC-2 type transport system ATP-binding protein